MTKERTCPKPDSPATDGSDQNRAAANLGTSGHVAQNPVSEQSHAIIKEVSVRRRKTIEILANR